MKLTVLLDNNTYIDQYYLGEPAVCYYMEDGDARILLDVGYSDAYLENAKRMGIDLSRVTDIVLSHGHNDHTGGLDAFFTAFPTASVTITACPQVFDAKRFEALSIGAPTDLSALSSHAKLNLTKEPVQISEHVRFLGEIPRRTDFEAKSPIGLRLDRGEWVADLLPEDSALALQTENGTFLVLGCSHSGVCNIILQAKACLPDSPIVGLLGGMHLFDCDETLERTIDFLQKESMHVLYPCHCTSFAVRAKMSRTLPLREVGVGLQLAF